MAETNQKRPARGRPPLSNEQIANMRGHISTCALALFQEQGFAAVSMRRLAKESGVTVMTLYKYFDSKIDVLQAIWAAIFDELFEELNEIAAREPDDLVRLRAVSLAYVNYWLNNPQHYFTVFMTSGISQSDVRGFIDEPSTMQRFELLRGCLSAALKKNANPSVVQLKFELLICILHGLAHNKITISSYSWSEQEHIVNEAIDGLLST